MTYWFFKDVIRLVVSLALVILQILLHNIYKLMCYKLQIK